jgi:hypothetical protein
MMSIHKSVFLDNVLGSSTHVENNAAWSGLIDAHTNEFLCFAFGSETHRAASTLKVGNERSDVLVVQHLRSREVPFVRNAAEQDKDSVLLASRGQTRPLGIHTPLDTLRFTRLLWGVRANFPPWEEAGPKTNLLTN